jgi:hypothetical protein
VFTRTDFLLAASWPTRKEEPWGHACHALLRLDKSDLRKTLLRERRVAADIYEPRCTSTVCALNRGSENGRFANRVCPASYFPESHRDQRRAAFLPYLAVAAQSVSVRDMPQPGPLFEGDFQGFWDGHIIVEW